MRCSPRAKTVAFWSLVKPMGLRVRVTRSVLPSAGDCFFSGMLLPPLPERQQVFHLLAAASRLGLGRAQLVQGIEGRHDDVEDIGRAHGLGQNVMDASHLDDCAPTASSDHARPGGSRLQEYTRTAVRTERFVRDGGTS